MKLRYSLLLAILTMVISTQMFSITKTTVASGNWNNPAVWSPSGMPATYDVVVISHTVTINTTAYCLDMTVNAAGRIAFVSGQSLVIYRNLTTAGTWAGSGVLYQYKGTVTGTAPIAAPLQLRLRTGTGVINITSGTVFSGLSSLSCEADAGTGGSVSNSGSITVNGTFNVDGITTFNNAANGSLTLTRNITSTNGGAFNAAGVPNSVVYTGTAWTSVKGATYYDLEITNGLSGPLAMKSLSGNITVNNNFLIRFNVLLNCANFNVNINGTLDHRNSSNFTNPGTFTFGGTNPTLLRLSVGQVLGNVVVNCSGSFVLNSANTAGFSGALTCNNLTLTNGTLDVNSVGNYNLTINGNLTATGGTLQTQTGTVFFSGTSAQSISGTLNFYNVSSSAANAAVSSGTVTVSNILTVPSGSFGTSGGTILIPATGATSYARIGTVNGSLTGTGWTIESYIDGPATAYWQYLSTPINGNTIADWDSDTRFYMSGVGGNDGTACCPTFYSVRTYNEPSNTYTNVTSTGTAVVRGRGYMVWMADNSTQLTSPLVYNSVGQPNFSTVNYPVTTGGAGGGYNLVGNPYACPITYSSVVSASSASLDPSFVILLENGSYATDPNGGVIAPNQGFWCLANSGGNITFTESSKNTTALPNILKISQQPNTLQITANNSVNGLGSNTTIRFADNGDDNFVSGPDLPYLANVYENADNIWTETADNKMVLRNTVSSGNNKEVLVVVKCGTSGEHTLNFQGVGSFDAYNCIWMKDINTGKIVDLSGSQSYSFISETEGTERKFVIHFENKNGCESLKGKIQENTLEENTMVFNNGNGIFVKFGFEEITQATISVYNVMGQLVTEPISGKYSSESFQLNTLPDNQIYFVVIQSGEKRITRKIFY